MNTSTVETLTFTSNCIFTQDKLKALNSIVWPEIAEMAKGKINTFTEGTIIFYIIIDFQ